MTSKVVKSTSKGQITLPMQWRAQFNTENYLLKMDEKQIVIKPAYIEKFEVGELEEVVFDVQEDNGGKGISVDEMIKLLKKTK